MAPSSMMTAEHVGAQRTIKTGLAQSFQMIGNAAAAIII
jgi:hypothetical protein